MTRRFPSTPLRVPNRGSRDDEERGGKPDAPLGAATEVVLVASADLESRPLLEMASSLLRRSSRCCSFLRDENRRLKLWLGKRSLSDVRTMRTYPA